MFVIIITVNTLRKGRKSAFEIGDNIMKEIKYIHEPTPLQCGQAVLAMLTGKTVSEIVELCKTERETTLADMRRVLLENGLCAEPQRRTAERKSDLPRVCMLSLETPRCWHWSLYCDGVFYDPEHGVTDDFPECKRKFYWEILPLK